jgi:hypothetical protein
MADDPKAVEAYRVLRLKLTAAFTGAGVVYVLKDPERRVGTLSFQIHPTAANAMLAEKVLVRTLSDRWRGIAESMIKQRLAWQQDGLCISPR